MKRRNIYSILTGACITGILSGVIYYVLFYNTIDIFGVERVVNPEERHGKIFYTSLITTLSIIIFSLIVFLSKKKFFALGLLLPTVIGFWILISVGTIYLDKSNYYEPFKRQDWSKSESKPIKMVRWLIKNKTINDLSRKEVIQMLGPETGFKIGFQSEKSIYYSTFGGFAVFAIEFEDDKVDHTYIFYD